MLSAFRLTAVLHGFNGSLHSSSHSLSSQSMTESRVASLSWATPVSRSALCRGMRQAVEPSKAIESGGLFPLLE